MWKVLFNIYVFYEKLWWKLCSIGVGIKFKFGVLVYLVGNVVFFEIIRSIVFKFINGCIVL